LLTSSRVVNLNNCFPESTASYRGPLPKQKIFLNTSLDAKGPKYVAYVGGIGSGKTLIGCITVIHWAVMYGGDYLVCRQFYPELRDTTLKTFLEICPPELIVEHRVADAIIRLKTASGGVATIMFRALEDPDKMRSLNLSGFYIDEASQVSEAAFMLLQGRLRNHRGLRKGILTLNPNGHDWVYRWFFKQDHLKTDSVKAQFALVKAPSTENVHLPEGYVETMMASWSEDRIKREIYGSFDSFEGQVYSEFDQSVHVVRPFKIPDSWPRIIGIDHGFRNPACWLWAAVDEDGNAWVYREFYEREWLIEQICRTGKGGAPSVSFLMKGEPKPQQARIDPSVRARRGTTGKSDWDSYIEELPNGFPLMFANNDKTNGIDRVKTYLKVDPKTKKPRLFIFNTCHNLIDEFSKYRWQEITIGRQGKTNEKEEPMKVDDHAMDALRYLVMTLPEPAKVEREEYIKKVGYSSLEASLFRELQSLKTPKKPSDPFDS